VTWSTLDDVGQAASGFGDFAAGDRLRLEVEAPGVLPVVFVAPGPPPWKVTYPVGSLTLALHSAKDLPLTAAVVIVDGEVVQHDFAKSTTVTLRGVAAGSHTVVVAECDHLAKVFRLNVLDGEQRTLEVTLAPRTP
jgi:hypothetical protein